MIRNAVFASLIALGAASAAQAADNGPRLVNRGGTQEVVYGDTQPGNVVGGAYASVTGGGLDRTYQAAPGGRTEADTGLVGRVVNVNGEVRVIYAPATPATTRLAAR